MLLIILSLPLIFGISYLKIAHDVKKEYEMKNNDNPNAELFGH